MEHMNDDNSNSLMSLIDNVHNYGDVLARVHARTHMQSFIAADERFGVLYLNILLLIVFIIYYLSVMSVDVASGTQRVTLPKYDNVVQPKVLKERQARAQIAVTCE
jgi:hypothetical protein